MSRGGAGIAQSAPVMLVGALAFWAAREVIGHVAPSTPRESTVIHRTASCAAEGALLRHHRDCNENRYHSQNPHGSTPLSLFLQI